MLWKCCTQYARKFGKCNNSHRTGKGQFSLQSQRKAIAKNAQTTAQLHSSHMLAKWCLKFSKPGFSNMWTMNFQMFKLVFFFFFSFIFIILRLITLQYCSGFCHTLTWISHGFTCIPHPNPSSHLPLYPIPLGLPSAPGPSTCLMYPTGAGDLFHHR